MTEQRVVKAADEVQLIVFACEAGMGSSLMGANQLKKMVKKAKLDVKVIHAPVSQMPDSTDVIVTHKGLAAQAKAKVPTAATLPRGIEITDDHLNDDVHFPWDDDDAVATLSADAFFVGKQLVESQEVDAVEIGHGEAPSRRNLRRLTERERPGGGRHRAFLRLRSKPGPTRTVRPTRQERRCRWSGAPARCPSIAWSAWSACDRSS